MALPGAPPVTLRSLLWSVYAPTLLFAVGQGAVIPIMALAARDLGASVAFAGFVVALRGLGVLAFDVPAGWLVSRFGERRAMAFGTVLVVGSLLAAIVSPSPLWLAFSTLLMGCGWSIWLLAQLTYVTEAMPITLRGRALSTLGGANRIGNLIGPFLGAAAASVLGLDGAYWIHVVSALLACVLLFAFVKEAERGEGALGHAGMPFRAIVRGHSGVFLTGGLGMAALGALRATRQGAIPLWADHVGLDAGTTSILYGFSIGIETLLFYPAGSAMDHFGRRAVALPCIGMMALGIGLIPLTSGFGSLLAVGMLIGFGNGLGSGIVMTLGADFSPAVGRTQFLGAWRLCNDLGVAGGPLLFSGVTAVASLGAAAVAIGGIGVLGSLLILLRMPETLHAQKEDESKEEEANEDPEAKLRCAP